MQLIVTAVTIVLGALLMSNSAGAQGAAAPPLVKFEIKDGAIPTSLTGRPGDPQKGRQVIVGRTLGNCLACHAISVLDREPYHGNVAPGLDGIASRMSEGEMRLRLVDSTKVNPDTMMPPFYRVDGLNRVRKQFQGKTILTAEQVEDVLAFLKTLR